MQEHDSLLEQSTDSGSALDAPFHHDDMAMIGHHHLASLQAADCDDCSSQIRTEPGVYATVFYKPRQPLKS